MSRAKWDECPTAYRVRIHYTGVASYREPNHGQPVEHDEFYGPYGTKGAAAGQLSRNLPSMAIIGRNMTFFIPGSLRKFPEIHVLSFTGHVEYLAEYGIWKEVE